MNTRDRGRLFSFAAAFMHAAAVCLGKDADASRDRGWFEGNIDRIVTNRLEKAHIAGAVVVIVRDGKVLLSKGYGFARVEDQKQVDPEKTLFRIASISKVFTATAAIRLMDADKLDPDHDVRPVLRRAGLNLDDSIDELDQEQLLDRERNTRAPLDFTTPASNVQGWRTR